MIVGIGQAAELVNTNLGKNYTSKKSNLFTLKGILNHLKS